MSFSTYDNVCHLDSVGNCLMFYMVFQESLVTMMVLEKLVMA